MKDLTSVATPSRTVGFLSLIFVFFLCEIETSTKPPQFVWMGSKVSDELVSTVRSIIGADHSDMDIIRALHMAKNDVTAAINIIFDTPQKPQIPKTPLDSNHKSISPPKTISRKPNIENPRICSIECDSHLNPSQSNGTTNPSRGEKWWLVGSAEVVGLSTCKGRRVKSGEEVIFSFPVKKNSKDNVTTPSPGKFSGRGRQAQRCSEIMRFSTQDCGEIGRIPNEWARCLLPLVRDFKVQIEGRCRSAPEVLGIMDTILLSISVFIDSFLFRKNQQTSLKAASSSMDESFFHPLPTLFRLLRLTPFKEAQLTPGDLQIRKRPLCSKGSVGGRTSLLHAKSTDGNESENEECISDADLENIVGIGDSSELEEREPPPTLQCELRPYQKQALHWMINLEKGKGMDEEATTLHPCWEAYHLADKRNLVLYLNAFSGEASTEFPSTLQMARGGILADSMGLGKTIMTISLLLAHSGRGGSLTDSCPSEALVEDSDTSDISDDSFNHPMKVTKNLYFDKLVKKKNLLIGGGNLIICPMTLIGQWKAEIETHAKPGSLSIYVHYGQSRPKDANILAQSDVVLTTYGVLSSEFSAENSEDNGGLYSVRWFRVVLDEAHTIKSSKSQVSMATAALVAERRWCLSGTPIQNYLEDLFSLLRFLRIEPWGNWAWWNKLIQKPFEEGDERGLSLVKCILKPIMLRRTKSSTDREGR